LTAEDDEWGMRTTREGVPYGTLHPSECQQQFSLAFTHAIVAAARCTISNLVSDVETVDYTVRQSARHLKYTSSTVDVQMKCTRQQDVLKNDGVHWKLSKDHYDKLRETATYNRKILVVLVVPQEHRDWLVSDESGMLLRKAAYWVNLEGSGPIAGGSKTVVLPRQNHFNVEQLLGILRRVGDGGRP